MNRTDCDFVDTWLDDWLAGRVPEDLARRVEAHVSECERCRRLETLVRDASAQGADDAAGDDGGSGDLFDTVLSRTSGNPCGQAEMLLPALVDGELDATSRQIVASHLGHCNACAKLATALRDARDALPSLAEVEPPAGFTALVLSRTSRSAGSPIAEWWMRLLLRPRASLELAYVGAILIVVLVGNPVSAFKGAEEHARRFVGTVPVERIAAQVSMKQAAVGVTASAIGALMNQVRAIGVELSNQWLQARALVNGAWDGVIRATNWMRSFDWRAVFKSTAHTPRAGNKAPPKQDGK